MIYLLAIVLFYVIPAYLAYKYIQKAHYHPEGRWRHIKTCSSDILVILTPGLNLGIMFVLSCGGWSDGVRKPSDKENRSLAEWFFKPRGDNKNL